MAKNVAQKLIESHLVFGKMHPGEEIGLHIDQTLTQDATGTMVMLELEAMKLRKAKTEVSVQYVDHNQIQEDSKNPDDHLFLQSAAKRFGLWFSKAGNGISHQVHCERFAIPGKTLLGSDSHTPASGSLGLLAIGTGGLEVALAICGEPFLISMPKILGVKLTGKLPPWVSAKDVILEMLRRYNVFGGVGKIIEYYGPGLQNLTAMDRHVIANMGAELGATTTVFPSDAETKFFLKQMGREKDYKEIVADPGATYDEHGEIDLSKLEPLIALPSSPGNIKTVREVAGSPIYQSYIGSSANPCPRDFAMTALMFKGRKVAENVSLDVNPSSRQVLTFLIENDHLLSLTQAGARIHQAGCNGCIGMGQAPATKQISLRTVPRNFPGRSGTKEDRVYLCSPETAAASALTGVITDPRDLEKLYHMKYPHFQEPKTMTLVSDLIPPSPHEERNALIKGPNIAALPEFGELKDSFSVPVLLKMGDNISTDEISPAGAKVLPFRSNIPEISKFTFRPVDETFYHRAMKIRDTGSIVVGGKNYGQGSSREHAAISPRYLGVQAVFALSFARIHRKNLINFGVLPLIFENPKDYESISQDDIIELQGIRHALQIKEPLKARNKTKNEIYMLTHNFSPSELQSLLAGSLISLMHKKLHL
ncbi:MAG: aconitate hydratase [Verrucomicrobia bacterium]|nr:aconitate hydratase [Verrucomicrobiota bacterium]